MSLDSHAPVHHNLHCSPLPTHGPGIHFGFFLPSADSQGVVPALDDGESLTVFWQP